MYYINNYPEYQHVIYCGDCLDVMAALPAESIDIFVTSPPYNIGINYGSYKDTLSNDEYLEWMDKVAAAFRRVLKPDGSVFLNAGKTSTRPWIDKDIADKFRGYFILQNEFTWIKNVTVDNQSHGH